MDSAKNRFRATTSSSFKGFLVEENVQYEKPKAAQWAVFKFLPILKQIKINTPVCK
jgi:hypothetical protein